MQTHTNTAFFLRTNHKSPGGASCRIISWVLATLLVGMGLVPRASASTELIANGGFETGDYTGWTIGSSSPAPVVTNSLANSGAFSALIGSAGGGETPGDASIFQTTPVLPSGATLAYQYFPRTTDGIYWDWQDVYIQSTTGVTLATVMHVCSGAQTWVPVTFDLSAYAGQQVRITFLVHGDNFGDPTSMNIDNVSILSLNTNHWLGGTDGTWTGNVNNWASDAAGTPTTSIPTSADDIIFSATGAGNQNTTLGADFTIKSLTVNDPTAVTIGGANTLTISADNAITVNSGAGLLTISSNLVLSGLAPTVTVNNEAGMLISGVVGGTGGLAKSGSGTLTLTNINTYSGGTTVNGGILAVNNDGVTTFGTLGSGPVTVNGVTISGGSFGTLQFLQNASAVSGTFTTNGGAVVGDAIDSPTLGGVIQFSGSSTADHGTFTNNGGTNGWTRGGATQFFDHSTADQGVFINNPGTIAGADGGITEFHNNATAANASITANASQTDSGALGGVVRFFDDSTAGNASFTMNSGLSLAYANFYDNSRAGTAAFVVNGSAIDNGVGGGVYFSGSSSADHGNFTMNGASVAANYLNGGEVSFFNYATAGNGIFILNGASVNGASGGSMFFRDYATAGNGDFTLHGGTASGASGGQIFFTATSTALSGTFTNNGGTASTASGGVTQFRDSSTADNATLIANAGTNGGTGGSIQFWNDATGGTARLEVFGNGNLDISEHNTPGVTIGSLEGDGNVFLGGNNLTVGGNNLNTTFSGVMQDGGVKGGTGGAFTKIGDGILILAGVNTYTGDTTINGGLLQVDGSIVSNVIINPGGILGGQGSVGGITNSGIVSPGDSPGTLTVSGNYLQTSAGTLNIQIASAGSFDLLAAGGTANLAGTLAVQRLNNYSPLNEAKFTILTAAGGVNGTFGTISNEFSVLSLLDLNVLYNPNDVTLEFLANFTNVPNMTPNQSAVASALTAARTSPGLQDAINYLLFRSTAELHNDFDLIAPDELTSIFTIGFSGADVQNANIERHLEQVRNGASGYTSTGFTATSKDGKAVVVDGKNVVIDRNPVTPESKRWSFFIEGSGEFASVGSSNNASGYDFTTAGVTLGVDYRVNDNFAIGITGGYANSNAGLVNQGGINLNSGKGGVYATVFDNGFYADALVGAGYNSYDTTRSSLLGYAYGDANGWELDTLLNGGYNFQKGGLTFGPIVSLAYTQIHLDSFTETGSLTPLHYPNQSQGSLRTNLGGKISYAIKFKGITITPEVRVSWQHEYLDSTQAIGSQLSGGPVFTVNGPVVGRDSALVSAGVNVQVTPTISVYSYYDGQLGRQNFSSNNVTGGVKIDF